MTSELRYQWLQCTAFVIALLQWIKEEFLPYVDEIGNADESDSDTDSDETPETEKAKKKTRKKEKQKENACKKLSRETYEGIRLTGMNLL